MDMLGWTIDTKAMTISVPPEKGESYVPCFGNGHLQERWRRSRMFSRSSESCCMCPELCGVGAFVRRIMNQLGFAHLRA